MMVVNVACFREILFSGMQAASSTASCMPLLVPEKQNFTKTRPPTNHQDDPRNQTDHQKLAPGEVTFSTGSSSISISPEIVQILHLGDNSMCFVVDRLDVLWWQKLQNGHSWATC